MFIFLSAEFIHRKSVGFGQQVCVKGVAYIHRDTGHQQKTATRRTKNRAKESNY